MRLLLALLLAAPAAAVDLSLSHAPLPALPAPLAYDAASWRPALVPDGGYGVLLSQAASSFGAAATAEHPAQARAAIARDELALLMRASDPNIHAHMERVGLLAGAVARELGLGESEAALVSWGARIHDIGKTDEEILAVVSKPGRLSAEERRVMERHTLVGAGIVRQAGSLDAASRRIGALVALNHHENWDGTGYPNGVPSSALPLAARITNVADFYDALLENRPYRAGMTSAEALAIMEREAHKFDPRVWAAFKRVVAGPVGTGLAGPMPAAR